MTLEQIIQEAKERYPIIKYGPHKTCPKAIQRIEGLRAAYIERLKEKYSLQGHTEKVI